MPEKEDVSLWTPQKVTILAVKVAIRNYFSPLESACKPKQVLVRHWYWSPFNSSGIKRQLSEFKVKSRTVFAPVSICLCDKLLWYNLLCVFWSCDLQAESHMQVAVGPLLYTKGLDITRQRGRAMHPCPRLNNTTRASHTIFYYFVSDNDENHVLLL